jgi:hypothetical protein
VPSGVGVERADPDEPVHAALARELAERERPDHAQLDRANARLFARRDLQLLIFELVRVEVPRVHAQQHAGPVAAFGASGARVDAEEAVAHILRPRQQTLQFHLPIATLQRSHVIFELGQFVRVVFVRRQLEQLHDVFHFFLQLLDRLDRSLQRAELPHHRLRPLLVVPEPGRGHLVAQLLQLLLLARQVKASPGFFPPGPPDR